MLIFPVIDHLFNHNIVKVVVDPQTILTMLWQNSFHNSNAQCVMLVAASQVFPLLDFCLLTDFILYTDVFLGWHGNWWGPQNNLIYANNTSRPFCNPHNSISTVSSNRARWVLFNARFKW